MQRGRRIIAILGLVLIVAHHDIWFWDDPSLVFGFLPVGLAYHMLFSVATAALWLLALRIAWPEHLERWANESDSDGEARR